MKRKIIQILSVNLLAFSLFVSFLPVLVYAQAGENQQQSSQSCRSNEVETSVPIAGGDDRIREITDEDGNKKYCILKGETTEDNAIIIYLVAIVRFLSAGVGLVIAFMIVVGGIEYITSSGNPQRIEHAKKRLTESIEALILFIFMMAILNFVIPGGIIG